MDDLKQRLKNWMLLINGLNEIHQHENGVQSLGSEILRVFLKYTDIDEIVNLGKNTADQTVTKVTFTSMWARTTYYRVKANLKDTSLRFWINEDLVPERLNIATAVRSHVKNRKLYKSWTNMGKSFANPSEMGTPAKLETVADVDALIAMGVTATTPTQSQRSDTAKPPPSLNVHVITLELQLMTFNWFDHSALWP